MTAHYARTLFPAIVEPLAARGTISVEDRHYTVGSYGVWSGKCNSGMSVALPGGPDAYGLYLPTAGGMLIDTDSRLLESVPGRGLLADMSSFKQLTLFEQRGHMGIAFEKSAMVRQLSELLDAPVPGNLEFAGPVDLMSERGMQIAALGNLIWHNLTAGGADRSSAAFTECLLQAMMISLLETVPHNYSAQLQRPASPAVPRQLKRAMEYMHTNAGADIRLIDVAREAGASVRSLQAAFQQFKNTTPIAYLRMIRLQGARRALMDSSHSRLIADIARDWGFSHMGRFAALYYQCFGEMPSETVKQPRHGDR
ncbi:AraC family transcriptional regulator [Rhizobium sp. NPDC090279]|uniref:AraC family transcriptional regulator n=1 Tax=Rhizobium sp. NPDC090279 TaxID=3364499 RepID=UPI00383BEDDF